MMLTQSVTFQAFMDPKPSSPKLSIQQKLENWSPPDSSIEGIQEKLAKAEERRYNILSDVTLRASNHLKSVSKTVQDVRKQYEEKCVMIEQKLKQKEMKGVEAKENQKQTVESKVSMKMEKIAFLKESKENDLKKLEESLNAKVLTASQRKEQFVGEEMERTAETNKKKLERAQLVKNAKESVCEKLKENLLDRIEAVVARKDEVVMEKATKAAFTNQKVLAKLEEIKTNQMSTCLEKEIKTLNKLEAARKRKVRQ